MHREQVTSPEKPKGEKPKIPDKLKNRLYPVVLEIFSYNDFHQVKIRVISEKSGVSVGTIYKYFSSKENLLFYVLEEKIKNIYELIRIHIQGLESTKEIFRKILWVTMDYYDKNPGVAITAFITVPTRTWMQQESFRGLPLIRIFIEFLDKARKRGDIDPLIDIRLFQDIYYMICYRITHKWYYFGMKWKLVDPIRNDFHLFWKLIAKPSKN